MPLTLADLQAWDPEQINEVAEAAAARARASREKAQALANLPALAAWEGAAGEAAREALRKSSTKLELSAQDSFLVSVGAKQAYQEAVEVKRELGEIFADAAQSPAVWINTTTNTVEPPDTTGWTFEDAATVNVKAADLQDRIEALLAKAEHTDADLARVVAVATGQEPANAEAPAALPVPPPGASPEDVTKWWHSLTTAQQNAVKASAPGSIRNVDGIPTGIRDDLNRAALGGELGRAHAAAAQADALTNQHPDWAQGNNIPEPNKPGAIFDDRLAYEAWQRQYDTARNGAKYLPDLQAVDKAVTGKPDRKLILLDTESGRQTRAAIAVGDPDTATHVSVTTPGLNTTVHGAIEGMADEATHLRDEALQQLSLTPGHEHDTVSAIAWIGYDTPQIPGLDEVGKSLSGGWDVTHDNLARAGAHDLARFYDGLGATHQGLPADLTAIGHSYGSLTTGLALQEPGNHGVTDALFYGSPGIEASTPQQLHLEPGHVYTMEAPDDPIQWTYDGPPLAHAAAPLLPPPLNSLAEAGLGALDLSGAGHFGPNPATNPNFTHLGTGPTTVPDGRNLEGVSGPHAHSQYPQQGDNGQPRTSGYNIAAIIAGLGDQAIPED